MNLSKYSAGYLTNDVDQTSPMMPRICWGEFIMGRTLCVLMSLLLLGSCSIDNTYDLSKDIDLTMALGSDGLALKLGNTEKMYLRDIIKTDDSSLLDTLVSGNSQSLYYLVKKNSSNFSVGVRSVAPFDINPFSIPTHSLFVAGKNVSGANFYKDTLVSVGSTFNVKITDLPVEVKEIHSIPLTGVYATIQLSTDNPKFRVASYTDLKIKFPDFIKSTSLNNVGEYVVSGSSGTITMPVQSFEFPVDGSFGKKVVNGEIQQAGAITISGSIRLSTNGAVDLSEGETVKVIFNVAFTKIYPQQVTGLVDPSIHIDINPIQIKAELPEFLKDEAIRFSVTNPTIKFQFNGQNLPVPLLFRGILESRDNNQTFASVSIPQSGRVGISKESVSVSYFSQTGTPFDPSGVVPSANKETVANLNSLIIKLPEEVSVDFNDGKVIVDPNVEHSIGLGKNYDVGVDYQILIPFLFDKGLKIVYTDSVADMNKDLRDYQAEGVTITATALNAIPLNLAVEIIPCDINGKPISEISVGSATIASGEMDKPKETEVSIKLSPKSPADVSKIDRLKFRVTASASDLATGEMLLSSQYVQLNNLRIKLNGKIIKNFN
jgi:hypothetical protein